MFLYLWLVTVLLFNTFARREVEANDTVSSNPPCSTSFATANCTFVILYRQRSTVQQILDKTGNSKGIRLQPADYARWELSVIDDAIQTLNNNTCVQFARETSSGDVRWRRKHHVEITNRKGLGCSSFIGRHPWGATLLNLDTSLSRSHDLSCVNHGTVTHELLHALGLYHEHSRFDRSKYITVMNANVISDKQSDFSQTPRYQAYGTPYNYFSVMHYRKNEFVRFSNQITIKTTDHAYEDVIGRAWEAQWSDYAKICSMYKCTRCMGGAFVPRAANAPIQTQKQFFPAQTQSSSPVKDFWLRWRSFWKKLETLKQKRGYSTSEG